METMCVLSVPKAYKKWYLYVKSLESCVFCQIFEECVCVKNGNHTYEQCVFLKQKNFTFSRQIMLVCNTESDSIKFKSCSIPLPEGKDFLIYDSKSRK